VGTVEGRTCILIDDIADTSHTIVKASSLLKSLGAVKIYALITHGIFSGDALRRVQASCVDEVIVSDTVPLDISLLEGKGKIFTTANIFAEAIRRIHNGESVSYLFDQNMVI